MPSTIPIHTIVADSAETTGLKWVADSQNTVIDAKGDLLVGSSADTLARLAVGTNDYVLTADSTATNGIKWAAVASSASALTLITPTSTANSGGSVTTTGGEVSFSGCTSVSVNGVFSSTYTNYLIITDSISANTQTDIYFRLRASGTDTTTNYGGMTFTKPFATGVAAPVSIGSNTFGTASVYFGDGNNTGKFFNNFIISSPNVATKTSLTGALISEGTYQTIGGYQSDNTQFDGFTFYTTTNNITGKVRVYGYSK